MVNQKGRFDKHERGVERTARKEDVHSIRLIKGVENNLLKGFPSSRLWDP